MAWKRSLVLVGAIHALGSLASAQTPRSEQPGEAAAEAASGQPDKPLPPRSPMSISINVGAAVINAAPLRDVLQNATINEQGLDFDFLPGRFGVRAELNTQESAERHAHILSDYQSIGLRLAPTYLVAPPDSRINGLLFVGPMVTRHDVYLDDGVQFLESHAVVAGVFGGGDLQFRIVDQFNLQLRATLSSQRVHFSQFNSKHNLVERSVLFGGSFAF